MPNLHCTRCQTIFPLSPPRRIGNVWYALCEDCKQDNEVEPAASRGGAEPAFRLKVQVTGHRAGR